MRRGAPVLVCALALAAVAGCGGGDKSFHQNGIGITFRYPSAFDQTSRVSFGESAGASAVARGAIALDRTNIITVSRYALKVPITKESLVRYKGEVDGVIGQLAGKPVSGQEVEYGGLPGYQYSIGLQKPANGASRMVVLFDKATEYLLNCQSVPDGRDAVEKACRTALDTLTTSSRAG